MSASPSDSSSHNYSRAGADEEVSAAAHVPEDWRDEDEDDDEDDDVDFEPAVEETMEDEDEEEAEYEDASEDLSGVEIEFEVVDEDEDEEEEGEEENEDDENDTETEGLGTARVSATGEGIVVTRYQLAQLVAHHRFRRFLGVQARGLFSSGDDETDEDDGPFSRWGRRRTRAPRAPVEFEKVPNERGQELMVSGNFGANETKQDTVRRKKKLAARLLRRELGLGSNGRQKARDRLMRQDLIPTSTDSIIHYPARTYSGQFSADGNFFFSCGQDFRVHMYDTSNPYQWKFYKVVNYPYGNWTITDASLSPDNRYLASSSISHIVCLASTDPSDSSHPRTLDFTRMAPGAGRNRGHRYNRFGIWSIRFSGDGREIVAGTADRSVYVFDIERNQSILRIPGHEDDVNAVCFGDTASPHILYSGSDDTTLKVWDRRSLGDGRPAGVFLGHTEGLTYVDSKGDGRYIISNGKDQTAKLWDLRKVIPTEQAENINIRKYTTGFEYRSDGYSFEDWKPHPHDCSLVTFRGHQVLRTLIRCHFSPPGSTDSRYVYSGSKDGKVYIWNLDATLKKVIDVEKATDYLREGRQVTYDGYGGSDYRCIIRDASWHPDVPMIAATSWNGWSETQGTCTVHSWTDGVEQDDGEPLPGQKLDAKLVPGQDMEEGRGWGRRRARRNW